MQCKPMLNQVYYDVVQALFMILSDIPDYIIMDSSNFIMKFLLILLVATAVSSTEVAKRECTTSDIGNFITGFLEGLNVKGDVNALLNCTKGVDKIMSDIKEALSLIVSFDFSKLIQGFQLLFNSVVNMLSMFKPCWNGFWELQDFFRAFMDTGAINMALKFYNNPAPYMQDAVYCIQNLIDGKHRDAGKNLGDFLYRLVMMPGQLRDENKTLFEIVYEMAQGFIDGLNKGGQIQNMDDCIDYFPGLVENILETIEYLKTVNWQDAKSTLIAVRMILEDLARLLLWGKPCSRALNDLSFLHNKLVNLDAVKLIRRINENILNIIHCFTQAIKHMRVGDHKMAATNIGEVFYFVLLKE
eukprot:TRINITY_DN4336_c0_g1_i4.p1 TRINITY_DN4336_c0_g1~~TRINITY_DN4336_c0_g1_i4.p1  ORF type:complete len:357 (+),score=44.14 TRINITY_DN4336_c0_g1_i4:43-1113(+)